MKNLLKVTLVAAATFALAPTAAGQSLAPGFALQRYYPAEVGSDWFAVDSLDLRGSGRPAAGLVLDYGHKPLVLRDADGNQLIAPIEHQLFAHLGAAVNVADRLRFALSVPIAFVNTGTPAIFDNVLYQASEGVSLGDIRLAVDLGLFGSYGDPFRIALGVQTFLPTGGRSSYTGDGKVRIAPHLSIAGDVGVFVYAVAGAFAGRLLDEPFGGQPLGNGIRFAGAAGVRVADGRVLLGPELHGETSVNADYTFKGPTTPLEVLLGAHVAATDAWRIGLGVGHAFTSAVGSPDVRLLFALTYFMPLPAPPPPPPPPPAPVAPPPPPPPADEDKDGVPDSADDCPKDAGLPALKGCPDGDGDGIADKVDACPKEAGPAHDDPAKNGCPAPVDTDKDGIVDPSDACPDRYGDPDPDPAKNGCPKVTVLKGEIKILERIEFDTGKSTLRPESGPLLTAIKRALVEHPEIKKVRLEGYTDSRGGAAFNLKLSQARVDAVMQWLIKEGIEPSRMTAKGFGKASPIAPNNTEEGRQSNRRVQIVILE